MKTQEDLIKEKNITLRYVVGRQLLSIEHRNTIGRYPKARAFLNLGVQYWEVFPSEMHLETIEFMGIGVWYDMRIERIELAVSGRARQIDLNIEMENKASVRLTAVIGENLELSEDV